MPLNRIDPKTRRIIVSDLTPPHKDQTTGIHGVGDGTIIGSDEFDDYKKQQEEEDVLRDMETEYKIIMENEQYASNRRGYEIR